MAEQPDVNGNLHNSPIKDIAICIQFLSRLPLPARIVSHERPDFERISWAFPLAGLVIALPAALSLFVWGALGIPSSAAIIVTLIIQTMITGALHEDGLADTADGFGGSHDRARKLDIMKDSRTGTFGVVALILAYGARFSALSALFVLSPSAAFFGFLACQSVARVAQVQLWHSLPPARDEGLSASFGAPGKNAAHLCLFIGCALATLFGFFAAGTLPMLAALLLSFVMFDAFKRLCIKQIGGQTGDTIGAVQIVIEIAFLFGLITFSA